MMIKLSAFTRTHCLDF